MIRLNLGFIRSSSLPGVVGLCAGDQSGVAGIVNEAQERLINDPLAPDEGWWGSWGRMRFNVSVSNRHAYITTPNNIARVIVTDVCNKPVKMRNGFYEFLQYGSGLQPKPSSCSSVQSCACHIDTAVYDRDNVVTLTDQTVSPAKIRFYPTDTSDLGNRILVQGTDQNGQTVTSLDPVTQSTILGEYVSLAFPFVDTVNSFTTLTGFLKDKTIGMAQVFQVDSSGNEFALSSMEPRETTPYYRRYLLNGLPIHCCDTSCGNVNVTTQVKFDFVPVLSDSDYTIIQSLPALIEEVQSIRFSRLDSANAVKFEEKHHARALQLLFGQLTHYLGTTTTAISIPIAGSDKFRLQPR